MSYRDSQRFRKVYGYYRPLPRATDTSILANKEYTDEVVAAIDWKQSVRVATTQDISLTSPGNIDGVSLVDEDRVLVKNQTNAAENGIYVYYSASNQLIRSLDAIQDSLTSGAAAYVEEGTENNGTAWILSTTDPITVGTTNQSWVLFSTIHPVFVSSGSYARSSFNVSFGSDYTDAIGSDVFFFVSGTIGTAASQKIAVFGGDTVFSGTITSKLGFSGSLTKLADGTSYLIAGSGVTITSSSNGSITIASTASGGGGDPDAQYLVLSATGSLSSERIFTAGTGLSSSDSGAGGNYTLSINDSVVSTVSGTTFTGVTKHNAGLSGSLTKLTDGTSYLVAGNAITITSASNGSITITSTAITSPGGATQEIQYNKAGAFTGSINFKYDDTTVLITGSLAQGSGAIASGIYSHAAGRTTVASGQYSHAEGWNSVASGNYSHAEGTSTSSGAYSHAEGVDTDATNTGAHAEGDRTLASGQYSHAEGLLTIASADYAHAEGQQSEAVGEYSHTEGLGTIASGSYQHVIGKYNKRDNNFSLFVIGNGTGDADGTRSDVLRINSGSLNNGIVEITGSLGMKGNIIPDADTTYTLGTSEKRWGHIYTGDLHLRNERGDWTIVEEREFLCVVNNITGKKYKMMLMPLDSDDA